MVMINSGGAAGSGSGASPQAPKPPKEADDAMPCEKTGDSAWNRRGCTPATTRPINRFIPQNPLYRDRWTVAALEASGAAFQRSGIHVFCRECAWPPVPRQIVGALVGLPTNLPILN